MIFAPIEKKGGNKGKDQMLPLVEDIMQQWDLLDINPKRGIFTWINNRVGVDHMGARLDHFLVQSSLLEKRVISSKTLPRLTSDHKPILLQLEDEENLGPIPFRFNPI